MYLIILGVAETATLSLSVVREEENMHLYTCEHSPFGQKVQMMAKYLGIDMETTVLQMADLKKPEFLAKNPLGRVPTLELDDGKFIWESANIACALCEMAPATNLIGATFVEKCQVREWIISFATDLEKHIFPWIGPLLGYLPYNGMLVTNAKNGVLAYLKTVEKHLTANTYFAGNRLTVADFNCAADLNALMTFVFDKSIRATMPAICRHFKMMTETDAYTAVYGELKYCVTPLAAPKKEKKEPAKKQEKKQEKPAEEPKKKAPAHPCAALAPASYPLDAWKAVYSNADDTRKDAMPVFWENYDPKDYCLYKCTYKYQDELEVGFMTANLASGFLQRCDPIRKFGFGNLIIAQDLKEQHLNMFGAWLFRGTDLIEEMKAGTYFEIADAECYTWERLNPEDATDRKFIDDVWSWESDDHFGGRGDLVEGKTFK